MAVPVIDFSKLEGENRAVAMAEIAGACEEWGFFQLINHGISLDLLDRVKKVVAECYKMEREESFKDSRVVQLMEQLTDGDDVSRTLDDVDWEDAFFLQDDNLWPSKPSEFKETMTEFRSELKKLAERITQVMEENLGLAKGYIQQVFSGSGGQLPFFGTKISHYPPCPCPERVAGLRAHTDAGGLILLFQDDKVSGLQVLKDGRWFDIHPLAGAIVINTGDQIEVISNGRYKSAWHHVLVMGDGNRRSVASFYNPALEAEIKPAMISGANAAYSSFVFGDYMKMYSKQKFMPKEPRFHAAGNI